MTVMANEDRRAKIRRAELLLVLEQWGPDYAAAVSSATDDEREWLEKQTPAVRPEKELTADEWRELRRAQGRQANAAAGTAFLEGRYDEARDLIDDALAHGGLLVAEWERLHEFITERENATAE